MVSGGRGPCVLIVGVEASADELGAGLIVALRARLGPETRFVGVGGPRMITQGLHSAFDPAALAVLGVFNALAAYPEVRRRVRQVAALAAREHPDVAVLIDAWGFTLRIARALRRVAPDLPLIKYVAPQVWATRPGRARTLARTVDKLLTIHSFDGPLFEREGLSTTFVGNPALNRDFSRTDPDALRVTLGAGAAEPLLLMLPGSRAGEIDRLMPVFGETARILQGGHPGLKLIIAAAEGARDRVAAHLERWTRQPLCQPPCQPVVIEGEAARLSAMRAATVALACSGTVTTELALAGCPMVVAYRLDPLTHLIAKALIRTPYITLFNVAAQRFVAPERVQAACVGEVLAADVGRLLDDEAARLGQIAAQRQAVAIMRGGVDEPIEAAADAVVAILREAQPRSSTAL